MAKLTRGFYRERTSYSRVKIHLELRPESAEPVDRRDEALRGEKGNAAKSSGGSATEDENRGDEDREASKTVKAKEEPA